MLLILFILCITYQPEYIIKINTVNNIGPFQEKSWKSIPAFGVLSFSNFPKPLQFGALISESFREWWHEWDLNPRPLGYEPNEMT